MNTNQTATKSNRRRLLVLSTLAVLLIAATVAAIFLIPRQQSAPTKTDVLVILPLSGKGASHGEYVREGLQMFKQDHPDSRIQASIVDSESNPQKAVSGFEQQLLLHRPGAAISVLSLVSDTVAPIAERNHLLLIGVNTATDTFVNNYTVTQRINDRPLNHTAPLARLAAKRFGRVGIIHANEAFGAYCKTTFEAAFRESSQGELIVEPYNIDDRDQSPVVQRLLSRKPDAVYVAGYGQPYIAVFQALRTFNYRGPIFADINFSNPQVLSALGDAAEGVVFAAMGFNVSPPPSKQAAAFRASYQNRFKREPWLGSAFAYDSLAILDHLDRTNQPLQRSSIASLKEWPGIAAPLSFPSPGECQYSFQFVRRTAGKNVPVQLETLPQ
jgi:branched-chain amino acid transport system substrate-binding protein